jgi:rSAM/selenodomain-associated transferase 1
MDFTPPSTGPVPRTLGVFAKEPRPGSVKTRLAAVHGSDWSARVAAAFLLDTLERFASFPARRVLAFAPPDAGPFFQQVAGARFHPTPQADGDLGRRMAAFVADRLREGAGKIVLLGTDSPTLPVAYVEQAFAELDNADVVLGPATDGGYCLLGCERRLPPIFEGISWGGPRVLADTVSRLADPAWRLALLPPWYDVDTPHDLQVLRGHLAALRRAGLDPLAPRTEQLLQSIR